MTPKNYFGKLLNALPLFTVSLPSSDNLAHFLGHMTIKNPFKYSIICKIGAVIFRVNTFP